MKNHSLTLKLCLSAFSLWLVGIFILFPTRPAFGQYSIRLGYVLEDMSKSNLEKINTLSHAFSYRFGVDIRFVFQKRADLLLKLYQNDAVDFLLTELPQLLALEKSQTPYKVILKSMSRELSDSFIILLTSKKQQHSKENKNGDSIKLQLPMEYLFSERSHVILSEKTSSNKLFFPDLANYSQKLLIKDIRYTKDFFASHFNTLENPLIVDIRKFPNKTYSKIRSYRDASSIEKVCGCKVYKMSSPIPDKLILVRPAFYKEHPLQTYQLMEFFLLLSDDVNQSKNISMVFKVDGFLTATNNLLSPYMYFLSRFKFKDLAGGSL